MLTVKQVAEVLQMKETTIREWLRSGKLNGVHLGRNWRIPQEELERFIKESQNKN